MDKLPGTPVADDFSAIAAKLKKIEQDKQLEREKAPPEESMDIFS